ncbi:hypothetical protein BGZ96_006692 [Linnemannia gamsii]|uniref:Galactose oxidase n=1 Tax=Linnemannia gamsii TaxID=64522 RepID=A0ABQ7K207_9FUNG|nr:hypothetical protein BGZ96_006692 [Linnemannia gamsii]
MKFLRHFTWPLSPSNLLAPIVLLLFTSSTPVQHHTAVSAQGQGYYTPIVTTGAAFARTQTKLYVISGNSRNVSDSAIKQFMSLDLKINWSATAPAWTKLADGPEQDIFPAAFTSDEQTMFVFHLKIKGLPWQYQVERNTWFVGGQNSFTDMDMQGVSVVTDPRTSLMYVPEGYDLALNTPKPWNSTTMVIFDPLTSSLIHSTLDVPDEVFPVRQYCGNVWSKKRNTILYFGGHNLKRNAPEPKYPNVVTEFSPDTMTFRTLASSATAPSMRADHCMAANEDGSKVVLFGGRLWTGPVSNEVFVLDVDSGNWTQGVSANQTRMYPACTVAGNQLIVWGGRTSEFELAPPEILIYDFVLRTWTTQYTAPPSYANLTPPPKIVRTAPPWAPVSPTSTSSGFPTQTTIPTANPNPGVVAAGVVGGLGLVAAAIGIFFLRYRRNQHQRKNRGFFVKTTSDDSEESKSLATAAAALSTGRGGSTRSRGSDSLAKDPMESNEEYELERTLMDLEEQKRELELKQQQLVLQHRAGNPEPLSSEDAGAVAKAQKRGPTAYVEPEAEYIPVSTPGFFDQQKQHRALSLEAPGIAGTKFSEKSSSSSNRTPTTHPVPLPSSSLSTSSYISPSSIVRTMSTTGVQGGLVQMVSEPMYGPNPGFDPMTPDLVYGQQTGSGKEWVRRAQGPQMVVGNPGQDGTAKIPRSPATIPLNPGQLT